MTATSTFNTRALDALVLVALFVAVWQGLYEYAGDAAITSPLTTLGYASSLVKTSNFWGHAQATLVAFLYSLAISIALGVALGLVLGFQRFAGDVAEPILVALYTIPKVTLYPLILLIFGLGVSAKVAFGVIHGVIPIILFTLNAVKNINPVLIRTGRVMRLSVWQTVSTVLAPAVMPELITGMRVGFSLTMLGVLIGEMFASQRGLGFLIINGISMQNVRMTMAVILIVVVFAIAANGLLLAFDRRMRRGCLLRRLRGLGGRLDRAEAFAHRIPFVCANAAERVAHRHAGIENRVAALLLHFAQHRVAGADHGLEQHARHDHEPVAHPARLVEGDLRALAFPHIVEEARALDELRYGSDLFHGLRRLDKGHVGAGFERRIGTADRFFEAQHGARIRARDDHEIRIRPRRDRRAHLREILVKRHDHLVVEMAALLREALILDMQ